MKKMLSGITMLVLSLPAFADEAAVATVPRVEADPTAMIVFAALFVALIGGFFYYLTKKDSADKKKGGAE